MGVGAEGAGAWVLLEGYRKKHLWDQAPAPEGWWAPLPSQAAGQKVWQRLPELSPPKGSLEVICLRKFHWNLGSPPGKLHGWHRHVWEGEGNQRFSAKYVSYLKEAL